MHQRIIQHSLEMANLKPNQCRWPIGDPDSENFHFCGETVFVGKPYCYEHCKQAYQFTITPRQYQIGENRLVAYFDNTGRLVFVLDETVNDTKPNALLVIDSDDGRKWDDILVNDWHVDLETVRPKKDNKYQKLDIEYTGLDVYSELLRAYDNDENLSDGLWHQSGPLSAESWTQIAWLVRVQ